MERRPPRMNRLRLALILLFISFVPFGRAAPPPAANAAPASNSLLFLPIITKPAPPPIRAVRVSYEDMAASRPQVPAVRSQLAAAGANMVGLAAGRPDWAYFKWATHPEMWSSGVQDTGIDFLAADIVNFDFEHVNAVVDIFAPNYIAANPSSAALSYWGEPSTLQVSTAALTAGPYHDLVLDMLQQIAANYNVDSISITELSYRIYGYGADDLALYKAYTGASDWPRDSAGVILIDDPSIGQWRSAAVAGFLAEAAARVHPYGKELFMDVDVSWGDLANEGQKYGQHYPTILNAVDRIVVWAYTDMAGYPASYTADLAAYLAARYADRQVIISVGMWGPGTAIITPQTLETAVTSAAAGGIPHTWITPSHLMTAAHWAALTTAWGN
ncbi:MAG: hypothetical protein ACE5E7_13865 [Anaerolineae bacterium]